MQVIDVIEIAICRDGGTKIFKDREGNKYIQDFAIKSNTRGKIFDKFPKEKDAKELNIELNILEKF